MPKVSEIPVKYRGGYRGPYIDIHQLIDKVVKLDILDFSLTESKVRGCKFMCKMQLRISNRLFVTWCASEVLSDYLNDCREKEKSDSMSLFPIEEAAFIVGEDRAYYLIDAPENALVPDERELEQMSERAKRTKR